MPEESPAVPTELRSEWPTVRVLADVHELTETSPVPSGARWTLAEPGRQLDANLIHLPAGQRVDTHTEPDLDVVLIVVAGCGIVGAPDGDQNIAEGNIVWLPRGSTRNLRAGDNGLSYMTVHRRRPGLQIKMRPSR
ncbi:cupin domain-containing protein [Kribbella sp. C-35]|uniref:cupin domain-containing protein n=1 Tax=Kribbella sp. C-35 TaxID=2789276 RepID=UPI003978DF0A